MLVLARTALRSLVTRSVLWRVTHHDRFLFGGSKPSRDLA